MKGKFTLEHLFASTDELKPDYNMYVSVLHVRAVEPEEAPASSLAGLSCL